MGAARRARRLHALAAAFALALASLAPYAHAASFIVFAAASLKESLDDVAAGFRAATGDEARVAYGASSALARQVDAGAPAELFISADLDWIADVQRHHRTLGESVALLSNELVLIAPAASRLHLAIAPGFALAAALKGGRLAIADPRAVPAGKYAHAALESLGVWRSVASHLAPVANVRAALALVARGEAPLGIVYRTDALAEPRVRIVDTFPDRSHGPIVYGMVLVSGATAAARDFTRYAQSPAARAIWSRHGFRAP